MDVRSNFTKNRYQQYTHMALSLAGPFCFFPLPIIRRSPVVHKLPHAQSCPHTSLHWDTPAVHESTPSITDPSAFNSEAIRTLVRIHIPEVYILPYDRLSHTLRLVHEPEVAYRLVDFHRGDAGQCSLCSSGWRASGSFTGFSWASRLRSVWNSPGADWREGLEG